MMLKKWVAAAAIIAVLEGLAVGQDGVSLDETFDWMSSTLQAPEGNNSVTHRPFERPYTKEWKERNIDPFRTETISRFAHHDCQVELNVNAIENDVFPEIGRVFDMSFEYSFNLKYIDPASIHSQDSCVPIETRNGPVEPWGCQDKQGKFIEVKTTNAKPQIHMKVTTSAYKSLSCLQEYKWQPKNTTWDAMCAEVEQKGGVEEGTYCDFKDKKDEPKEITSLSIGFSTAEYAHRFAEALRHAVKLCGGKPSTF
jgi:hypothetical protein